MTYQIDITPVPAVMEMYKKLADQRGVVLLESAVFHEQRGRYTYISADPCHEFELNDPLTAREQWQEFWTLFQNLKLDQASSGSHFQGGAIGFISYEFGQLWEKIPTPTTTRPQIPLAVLRIYDWVLCWDHLEDRCTLYSQGYPNVEGHFRDATAMYRLQQVTRFFDGKIDSLSDKHTASEPAASVSTTTSTDWTTALNLVNQTPEIYSNFTRDQYLQAVAQVIEYIRAGDIFQANFSQQLFARWNKSPLELYLKLREVNPAPYSAYFAGNGWSILSSSPEKFIEMTAEKQIITRPIKGTRRKLLSPQVNLFQRLELIESEKDRAENVMIVDLLRNDLSRVCEPGTIEVPVLCEIENFSTVQHLVSEIRGTLTIDRNFQQAIEATIPGGSITGAPKIRAMEIIAELEQTPRGAYCGNIFYQSFTGPADSSILIRTMTWQDGWVQFPVGGGIVVDSQPENEYQETLDKAFGMVRALE
jgi:para-aminobenzoate synthetase component 1